MSFFDLEWNFRGDSGLYSYGHCQDNCPDARLPHVIEPEENITNDEYPPLEVFYAAEPRAASSLGFPALIQGQPGQHLYVNDFHSHTVPEEDITNDENLLLEEFLVAEPQPTSSFEPPLAGNEPILFANNPHQHVPVAEPQGNFINVENLQPEPNQELVPAGPQPHHPPPPAIPAISNNAAYGVGNRPGQEFRCGRKCRGVFTGPHGCSYNGRSLTVSCQGDDGNCPSKFSKKNDFNRHCDTVHRGARAGASAKLDCPSVGCGRVGENGFKRKDNLTQHRRSVHDENIVKNPVRFRRGQ